MGKLRSIQRGINRRAIKQLYVQVFMQRDLWEAFEAEVAKLPEAERPPNATAGIHALMAGWLQGRRSAVAPAQGPGLIKVVPGLPGGGELTRRLREDQP